MTPQSHNSIRSEPTNMMNIYSFGGVSSITEHIHIWATLHGSWMAEISNAEIPLIHLAHLIDSVFQSVSGFQCLDNQSGFLLVVTKKKATAVSLKTSELETIFHIRRTKNSKQNVFSLYSWSAFTRVLCNGNESDWSA